MQPTRVVIAALVITIGASAAPQTAHAGKPPAILSSLPEDTSLVASVDLKKVIAAPIASDAVALLEQRAADQLSAMKTFGVDLEKDVTRVYVALAGAGLMDADHARLKVVVAEGKFAIDGKANKANEKTYAGVTYWAMPEADFAVISKRLYVVSDGHMPDLIDVIKGKVKNAVKSAVAKQLRAALAATTVTHEGWFVGTVSDADRKTMGTQGADMAWFSGSAALRSDAVDVAIRIGMLTADAAKTIADAAQQQLSTAKQSMGTLGLSALGQSLTVAATGTVVAMGATVTKQEIATISGLIQMMAPSMGSSMAAPPPPPPPPATRPGPTKGPTLAPTAPRTTKTP